LMIEYSELLFDDAPMILVTTVKKSISPGLLKPNMISKAWGFDFGKTGALIQDVLPKTKHLFVISGSSLTDKKLKDLAVEELAEFDGRYTIHYLDDFSAQDLLLKVAQLPENSAIFFLSLFRDVNGQSFVPRDIVAK